MRSSALSSEHLALDLEDRRPRAEWPLLGHTRPRQAPGSGPRRRRSPRRCEPAVDQPPDNCQRRRQQVVAALGGRFNKLRPREPARVLELAVRRDHLSAQNTIASNPSISELGNGHGCEETNTRVPPLPPPTPRTPRAQPRPPVTHPARRTPPARSSAPPATPPGGPSSTRSRSPSTTSMITTGSVRGWCSAPHAGHTRSSPASRTWRSRPADAAEAVPPVPVQQRRGVRNKPALVLSERRRDRAHAHQIRAPLAVGREQRAPVLHAEQQRLAQPVQRHQRQSGPRRRGPRRAPPPPLGSQDPPLAPLPSHDPAAAP